MAGHLSESVTPQRLISSASFRAALLLVAIAAGIVSGLLLLPHLFRLIPNDLARLATIQTAMEHAPPPAIVVFGDSRGEAAVDAALLTQSLKGKPLAYNFCWHGQRFDHAFVLYDRLPRTVRMVIQVVSLEDLGGDMPGDPRIYKAMRAYGLGPSEETAATLEAAFGRASMAELRDSDTRLRWDSRWGVRHVFDTGLRDLVRSDLMLERERYDLFFPAAYTQRVQQAAMTRALENYARYLPYEPVSSPKRLLLQKLGALARRRSFRLVLVIPAGHSSILRADSDRRVRELTDLCRSQGIEVLDLSRVLDDDEFVDLLHATTKGARKFTMALASYCGRS